MIPFLLKNTRKKLLFSSVFCVEFFNSVNIMFNYTNITAENIDKEHICCAIGDPKHQCGVDKKKERIKNRLKD